MSGILGLHPLRGILSQPEPPQGVLSEQYGLLGPATANPLIQRQVAAQRAANPRPDISGLLGVPQSWLEYADKFSANLARNYPIDSPESVREAAVRMAMNVGPLATVYHGSPHLFDKFDMSKVGTGEGAQAYGHGLYFAENPSVAGDYARKLGEGGKGVMYKADLPDEAIGKMLDWDKTLDQQPESVKKALRTYIGPDRFLLNRNKRVGEYFRTIEGRNSPQALAQGLLANGILGVRYLDQGSRARGQGTSNFVVFDDSLPKIIGRD